MQTRTTLLLCLLAGLAVTGALGASLAISPHAGAQQQSAKRCPAGEEHGFNAKRLVGMRLRRAERVAGRHECTVRVVKRDGEELPGTDDYNPWRINVVVVDGTVTRIRGIG